MASESGTGLDEWYSSGGNAANNSVNNGFNNYGQIGGPMSNTNAANSASQSFGNSYRQQSQNKAGYMSNSNNMGDFSANNFTSKGFGTPSTVNGSMKNDYNFDDEPPLLEELGINFEHIYYKTLSVINPRKSLTPEILEDSDLAGPFVFCWVQGVCLMFSGKLHFGYLFGFGFVGCVFMYTILNLMSQNKQEIDSARVISILGYSLLPMVMLSGTTIAVNLGNGPIGMLLTLLATLWSTGTATRYFEAALQLSSQRYLIAYPIFLFYACFSLITVF